MADELLEKKYNELRRAYTDLYNRINFTENRMSAVENQVNNKIQTQMITYEPSHGIVITAIDDDRLPERISDKGFSFISFPLMQVAMVIRNALRATKDLIAPNISPLGTKILLSEARKEREFLNVMRVQKMITRMTRLLGKGIRRNQDSMVAEAGPYTNDMLVIANTVARHFTDIGYHTELTVNGDRIFLHININY